MLYYESKSNDPYYNLALEDFLFHKIKEDQELFFLWQNDNAIIIGCHQNTGEEINSEYVNAKGITVARRMTGGGAVYHDLGNVNFTFVDGNSDKKPFQFSDFLKPLIDVLADMGVKAEFNGRNDATIDGKKFCGNAQHAEGKKLLHHGCILLDGDLTVLSKALNADPSKFQSKSAKSVKSRVTNINNETDTPVSAQEFMKMLKEKVGEEIELEELVLSGDELAEVQRMRDEKYATWEWNYGESPSYEYRKKERIEGAGTITLTMSIERGAKINDIRFYGDFFASEDIGVLEETLKGKNLLEIPDILKDIRVENYIHGVSDEDLLRMMDIKSVK
jgi:lipoate-protein ligase A